MGGTVKQTATQDNIVMLALARVGAAQKKVYSEHIAAEAHRLAPDVFGWELEEYRRKGWPDKEKVRIALIRLRSEHGFVEGGYAKDTSGDGWQLTPAGVDWVQGNAERVAGVLKLDSPGIPRKQAADFLKRIKRDPLFKAYREGRFEAATPYQFTDMLSCSPDAPRDVIAAKFSRLEAMAKLTRDQEVAGFFGQCGAKFAAVLGDRRVDQGDGGKAE